jgi:hypothetical protein
MPRFQDGCNSHGDHMERDVVPAESRAVGFTGSAGQRLDARAGGERRRGLVEPQVAVPADPQELQIYSPGGADVALVLRTQARQIVALRRRHVDAPALDLHAAQKVLFHERTEGAGM